MPLSARKCTAIGSQRIVYWGLSRMERFRGRIFLIALCLSLGSIRVQAGDRPAADRTGGIAATEATPVATAKPASADTAPKNTRGERLADADRDSADASDPSVEGEPAVAGDASAGDRGHTSAMAANVENFSGPSRAMGDQDLITMNFQNVDLPVLAKFI